MNAMLVIAFLLVPAVVLWLVQRFGWAQKLGAIVLCYALGLLAGNLGVLPAGFRPVQSGILDASIALALPMILLSVDIRAWTRVAGKALLCMALAVVSVLAVSTALFLAWRAMGTGNAHELAGLAVGIYTGGTPNLAAIKTALGVAETRYVLFNTFDVLVGAVYLLFMVSVAKRFFSRWLPAWQAPVATGREETATVEEIHSEDYAALMNREGFMSILAGVGVTLVVVAAAMGVAMLLGLQEQVAVVITLLTTFAILASLVPRVRRIRASYRAGMYLIYLFSFTVASIAQFDSLRQLDVSLLAFVALATFASVGVHALLCRIARIDVDTFLVTSMSSICSPPFVPMMARALGNPAVLLSGITTGIIGYAVGTYLGIALALLLKNWS
jgi:uncharacterized membrane protein